MIRLDSIRYDQFRGKPKAWYLDESSFGDVNLIVGKNAAGKSRTLNIIGALGKLLSGELKARFTSGNYRVKFRKNGKEVVYCLKYEDNVVVRESLEVGGDLLLDRRQKGKGKIYAAKMKQMMSFHTPEGELACVYRRDRVQHPFLEDLHTWGESIRQYRFGTALGKENIVVFPKDEKDFRVNPRDPDSVVGVLKDGEFVFGKEFAKSVSRDMRAVGYDLERVGIGALLSIVVSGVGPASCVVVKERDLGAVTDQNDMSQGMFRCLSLIIQLTYAELKGDAACILIDDVGEGLDYDRAAALIRIIVEKAEKSKVQLIMSTNDRFVMNSVPLAYWSIADRHGNRVKMLNYRNSKEMFEQFELTGLSNFDLFSGRSGDAGDGQ